MKSQSELNFIYRDLEVTFGDDLTCTLIDLGKKTSKKNRGVTLIELKFLVELFLEFDGELRSGQTGVACPVNRPS